MKQTAMTLVGVYIAIALPGFAQTPMVVLSATVADKSGHLMTDLPETAFQVFEDGVPQQIKFFKCEDAPVSIGLIIDSSASIDSSLLNRRVGAVALALVNDSRLMHAV